MGLFGKFSISSRSDFGSTQMVSFPGSAAQSEEFGFLRVGEAKLTSEKFEFDRPSHPNPRPSDNKSMPVIIAVRYCLSLGRVDGFDQDEAEGERDEGTVIARSLLATKGDALEALEFADGLLDARPRFVEDFREESGSVGCSRAMRNDRTNAALAGAVAIGFGVVTFVGDGGARQNIRSDVEQEFEVAAVAGFAPGQMEGERQAVEVDLEVDFG